MKIKRSLILILACVMLLMLTLASCEQIDAKKLEAEAAIKLLGAPYIMNMNISMNYSGDDDEINEQSGMDSSMSMNVDGKNFMMHVGSDDFSIEYIFAENVLYMDMMGSKLKAEMSEEDAEEMLGTDLSGIGEMSINTFSSVETKRSSDGKVTISCKGLNDDSNALIDSLISDIGSIGDGDEAVSIDKEKLEYVVVIDKDGRYESMHITILMTTEVNEEPIAITTEVKISFDYENAVEVTIPADADEYYDVGDIGDIFE